MQASGGKANPTQRQSISSCGLNYWSRQGEAPLVCGKLLYGLCP
ncbi:MAG: hypothetical protein COA47_17690 [Robiginitomaculum sp.]|nr:MAG: hypothetical protein COA47_17690 [Robiginitomaculum sp.]